MVGSINSRGMVTKQIAGVDVQYFPIKMYKFIDIAKNHITVGQLAK